VPVLTDLVERHFQMLLGEKDRPLSAFYQLLKKQFVVSLEFVRNPFNLGHNDLANYSCYSPLQSESSTVTKM